MRSERALAMALAALAMALRAAHAVVIEVPSNDGAHYLAMAEEFASGDGFYWGIALRCVLHPGSAFPTAVLVALGLESFVASRLVAVLCAGLTTLALFGAARALPGTRGAAALATLLFVTSQAAIRLVGEAYSEPVFQLLTTLAVLATLRGRTRLAGAAIGTSFWVRPEGLAFLPLLLLGRRWLTGVLFAAVVAAGLPVLRWLILQHFTLTPLLGFMGPMGPLGEPDLLHMALHAGRNLLALPVAAVSTLDALVMPLALIGLWRLRNGAPRRALACSAALAIGWCAMVAFQVKPRFFLSQWPLLLPLAALACAFRPATGLALAAVAVNLAAVTSDLVRPPRAEMRAEILLGHALRAEHLRGPGLVTDLPRVAWAAGCHPPQPLVWGPENLRELLLSEKSEVAVLGGLREGRRELMEQLSALWQPVPLPSEVQAADPGRLLLFRRRP
jgi:hypothetical protein